MKITLAQMPTPAGAIADSQDRLFDAGAKAVADGADVLVVPAAALAGDAGDMATDPGFALDLRIATTETVRAADDERLRVSFDPDRTTFTTDRGVKVTFAEVTDPATLGSTAVAAAATGTNVLALSAALPYRVGGPEARRVELTDTARRLNMMIVFCNRVGSQDVNVYDGGSMVIAADGTVLHQSPLFTPDAATVTVDLDETFEPMEVGTVADWPGDDEQIWAAMVVGTRDYVRNNGFTDVVIGLSGGIDSAVVAAVAADALGAEHVHGVGMPGPYSSEGSVSDARTLAENLGVRFSIASIKDTYEAEVAALGDLLDGPGVQVAKENIQARLRALHLFTIANARNAMVLNTCQASENSVGYATYGGDALGSYAPMADLLKRDVYRLAEWRNTVSPVIPVDSITKPPSAELSPGQQDTDTLPPYETLDTIIERYLVNRETPDQIVAHLRRVGASEHRDVAADVAWVLKTIDRSEWKRQQEPLGPRLSAVSFASRRVPVTNGRRHRVGGR